MCGSCVSLHDIDFLFSFDFFMFFQGIEVLSTVMIMGFYNLHYRFMVMAFPGV